MCGENGQLVGLLNLLGGSSPRVRGKQAAELEQSVGAGLIPACAGKTNAQRCGCSSQRAHPRVCGENILAIAEILSPDGSSPRVRGKPSITM